MNVFNYCLARAARIAADEIIEADRARTLKRSFEGHAGHHRLFALVERLATPEDPGGPGMGRVWRAKGILTATAQAR